MLTNYFHMFHLLFSIAGKLIFYYVFVGQGFELTILYIDFYIRTRTQYLLAYVLSYCRKPFTHTTPQHTYGHRRAIING